jgi:hypothetical protein
MKYEVQVLLDEIWQHGLVVSGAMDNIIHDMGHIYDDK